MSCALTAMYRLVFTVAASGTSFSPLEVACHGRPVVRQESGVAQCMSDHHESNLSAAVSYPSENRPARCIIGVRSVAHGSGGRMISRASANPASALQRVAAAPRSACAGASSRTPHRALTDGLCRPREHGGGGHAPCMGASLQQLEVQAQSG